MLSLYVNWEQKMLDYDHYLAKMWYVYLYRMYVLYNTFLYKLPVYECKKLYNFFMWLLLKLHNCFVYFNQKINPWRMVFFFCILLLRLLS